mgnify:CR=1 FL=1
MRLYQHFNYSYVTILDILKESSISSTVGGEKCQLGHSHTSNKNETVYDHFLQEKWMRMYAFYNV